MPHKTETRRRGWTKRALSAFLAAVLLIGMAPAALLPASAHWADEYLNQLVDWGFMRADQIGNPDEPINRAQFVAIINRAYGYTEMGPIPFTDVPQTEWFYDDISIAYTAGYMAGTSSATADPYGYLTREMATCILGRNMMMKDTPAESLAFTDSWMVSNWARGLVKTAVDNYVLSGYPDNSFRPQSYVSMGEMAVLVTRCVGTPLNQPGEYTLGDVFDNVTITTSGVTLRDTTISGDLYVSGGVGLGDVKLENVRVLGRIIVSGTGESEMGDASVVMRNVTANEMLVDNMRPDKNKMVTVRAEGLTNIANTFVRTPAYLEDNTPDDSGLRNITLENSTGGARLDLAGRIKEVVSKAPMGNVRVAKGTVQRLTVDEDGINTIVTIDRNAEVKELNLDVASTVQGDGDVKQMNINAPGVTSTVLPEKLYIRPGLTGNVGGEDLDAAGAEEYSRDPKILSGYPIASDIAPTSLQADFATNKRGTVYWAVSSITDGSISADDLIKAPTYGNVAVKNGSVAVPSADTVVNVPNINGLTKDGSYYLSAVMTDSRGVRSPVKVISFTTPDDTVPAFAKGYPVMSLVTDTLAQVTVMPTKSCKLYYAVLPAGAPAPTTNELRSASVTGNLGYGVVDVIKNTESTFTVSRQLEEQKEYVLYLWLSDADGAKSSSVQSLRFKTVDATPPRFDPAPNNPVEGATNVTLNAGLNEPGTIYWAAVPKGTPYPLPNNQSNPLDEDNIMDEDGITPISAKLDSEYAKLQVKNGRGAKSKGSIRVTNADTDVTMNVTNLARETGYDLYYVAQDAAGNFSEVVGVIGINTQDSTAPVVRQRFSRYTGTDDTQNPMANTNINLEFSEHITVGNSRDLLTLYRTAKGEIKDSTLPAEDAAKSLLSVLTANFKFYRMDSSTGRGTQVVERAYTPNGAPIETEGWVVDYHNVVIQPSPTDPSKLWVTFPTVDESTAGNTGKSALKLASGSQYYFEITGIRDNSGNGTTPAVLRHDEIARISNSPHVLPIFETVFAIVDISSPGVGSDTPKWTQNKNEFGSENTAGEDTSKKGYARVDASFRLTPQSTSSSDENISYEVVLFSDYSIDFDLYYRVLDAETGKPVENVSKDNLLPSTATKDDNGWYYLGNKRTVTTSTSPLDAVSVNKEFNKCGATDFPRLVNMKEGLSYEFAISVTRKDALVDFTAWSGTVNFKVYVLAGQSSTLNTATSLQLTPDYIKNTFDRGISSTTGRSIGQFKSNDYMDFPAVFVDKRIPKFDPAPQFTPGDTFVDVTFALDRAATVYYVVVPRYEGRLPAIVTQLEKTSGGTLVSTNAAQEQEMWKLVTDQTKDPETVLYKVTQDTPPNEFIADYKNKYPAQIGGEKVVITGGSQMEIHIGPPENALEPRTGYYMYFVIEGQSSGLSDVYLYNFTTKNTSKPKITMDNRDDGTVGIETQVPAVVDYIAFTRDQAYNVVTLLKDKLAVKDGMTLPSVYDKDMTALEALSRTYKHAEANDSNFDSTYDGYSVFDLYASDSLKQKVGEMIRTASNTGGADVAGRGTGTTEAVSGMTDIYRTVSNKFEGIKPGTDYVMVAVAHHTSSEKIIGDTYAACDPFRDLRMDPPKLTGFSGTAKHNGNGGYEGSFTITFDTDLYWKGDSNSTETAKEVWQVSKDPGGDSAISILKYLGVSNGVTQFALDVGQEIKRHSNTFTVKFWGLVDNGEFLLFNTGMISSKQGQTRDDDKLTIKLRDEVKVVGKNKEHTLYFDAVLGDEKFTNIRAGGWVEPA